MSIDLDSIRRDSESITQENNDLED